MIGSGGDRLRTGVMLALALRDGRGLSGDVGTKEEADAFSNFTESQLADNDRWFLSESKMKKMNYRGERSSRIRADHCRL
jgi:hypothetical protein